MAFNCECAEPVVHRGLITPAFYGVIVACREKNVLFRMPFNILDILSVATEHGYAIILSIISLNIGLSDPYGLVSATCGQVLSVRAPSSALDFILVPLQLLYALEASLAEPPYTRCAVKAGTHKQSATWVPCEAPHCPFVQVRQCVLYISLSKYGGYLDVKFPLLVVPPDDDLLVR